MRAFPLALIFWLATFSATLADAAIEAALRQRAMPVAASEQGLAIAAGDLIGAFYAGRGFRPAWLGQERVRALDEAIGESWHDGLDPLDFHGPAVARIAADPGFADAGPEAVAAREIILTDALLRLLYQLYFGKVDPRGLDPHWNFDRPVLTDDTAEAVTRALDAGDIAGLVARARLAHPRYLALREALARYRAIAAAGGWPSLPPGPTLRPGESDPAIPLLRRQLVARGDLTAAPEAAVDHFDPPLEAAVRRFQMLHGLEADGLVGRATQAALDQPAERRIDQLRVNLERARWVLRETHPEVIEVDIAGFSVEHKRHAQPEWQSRAIVGLPYRQTPVFADTIEYIVFNPTWTVPRGILQNDILPRIRANPGYLAQQGFDVIDTAGRPVPLETATRLALDGGPFPHMLVQRPGPLNALGRIKFMFPNPYAVYLHDTPQRQLFDRAARSFSSGCIRVEDTLGLAELLLEGTPGWNRARIEAALASGQTRTVFLNRQMPVRLLYRTADTTPDGEVWFRDDIYNRDAAVLAALAQPFRPVFPAPNR